MTTDPIAAARALLKELEHPSHISALGYLQVTRELRVMVATLADALEAERAENLRACAHLASVLVEPRRPAMTDTWQPIDTAPKDGSRVLLHSPDTHTYTPVLGTWDASEERWEEWGDYYPCSPAHWMPLPEPPKETSHD